MPGHFTHIYTAHRVADFLDGQARFNPLDGGVDGPGHTAALVGGLSGIDPATAASLMRNHKKFANLGAIGPDIFFFCEDYGSGPLASFEYQDDLLMLAMAIYYWIDADKEQDYGPLLLLLAEVNQTFARVVRFLIQLQKLWNDFVTAWNATIGPIVNSVAGALNDLTGGVIDEAKVAFDNLLSGIKQLAEEELVSFADIFSWFSLKMRGGFDEQSFIWSDMLHYRRTNEMARNLFLEADRLFAAEHNQDHYDQFRAFALGWVCHIGTDVIAHSFVNEQAGGPFRTHWQRHHVVENHIDAWNYRETRPGGSLPPDTEIGYTATYVDVGRSALYYAVALSDKVPGGFERPPTVPSDPTAAKKALDIDGEMPDWLANGIVRALIATYHHPEPGNSAEPPEQEPANLGGGDFQAGLGGFHTLLEDMLNAAGININQPIDELIAQVAPTPTFPVPHGYPMPWEVKTSYKFLLTYYKLAFWDGFDLPQPIPPDVVEWPPTSDFTDLASAPDFSGSSSGDPATDVCDLIKSILDWAEKEIEAAGKLFGDLVKALASPGTYWIRYLLWKAAMAGWDLATTAHELLAHLGFVLPRGETDYPDGSLRTANEIDHNLVSLGHTVDGAFLQALADASDPFGNLDLDPSLIGGLQNPRDRAYPYLPVRPRQLADDPNIVLPTGGQIPNEWHRPWAYPDRSRRFDGTTYSTPTEYSDPAAEVGEVPPAMASVNDIVRALGRAPGTVSGPYPQGATPHVLFRVDKPVDISQRASYEAATSPAETDYWNEVYIGHEPGTDHNPLGDPIPFSAYLMGRILDPSGQWAVDFNLDADRGFGYRCWDWMRFPDSGAGHVAKNYRGQTYHRPRIEPEGSTEKSNNPQHEFPIRWHGAAPDATQEPVQLRYLLRQAPEHGGKP